MNKEAHRMPYPPSTSSYSSSSSSSCENSCQIVFRGKTTPSAERQRQERASPLHTSSSSSSRVEDPPLSSQPAVPSIPVDSCVKPPPLLSPLLDGWRAPLLPTSLAPNRRAA
ncbi:unnamed protein product [Pleuronectes platessa]|uniref:Uncharacterized protein n=1 Tax=Pleuronectes platessa TaxID=8262 RepID=A0A9N7TZU3_PLEPL|nr:unnamed protein product [Pleuronectes platessa]